MVFDSAEALEDAVRRARNGDPEAFGPVVAEYQARLRAFIAGYVPRAEWVDDIAQQTFVSAYQSLRSYEPGTEFYRWLRQIAYNHLRAELERAGRRRRLERDHLVELTAKELARRLEPVAAEEDDALEALRDCMGRLPDASRQILDRHYREGTPLAAIARIMGRSAEGLKVTLFKIRAQLKACIEQKRSAADAGSP